MSDGVSSLTHTLVDNGRLHELLEAEHLLNKLNALGVDSWDGYARARRDMEEDSPS